MRGDAGTRGRGDAERGEGEKGVGACRVELRTYGRRFRQPLKTGHGEWRVRQGILLRLSDQAGRVGLGEIAPVPWFRSETLEQALTFCRQLPTEISDDIIFSIPGNFPACQFGFGSAWEHLHGGLLGHDSPGKWNHFHPPIGSLCSWLLPAGKEALQAWEAGWETGHHTFKWKIGVGAIADELAIFYRLIQTLPADAKLRLDANGSLDNDSAGRWLAACDKVSGVEFVEQPLPPDQFEGLLQLATRHATPIALDESVATLAQLQDCYQNGWRGICVIKPAIAGFPAHLRQFFQETGMDAVVSSVFETSIGQRAVMELAGELMQPDRAVGCGLNHWFHADDPLRCLEGEILWDCLGSNSGADTIRLGEDGCGV